MISKIKNSLLQMLHRSERYTKTDMVYLVKGGFWLSAGQIATTACTIVLAIAFANLMSRDQYGTYKYIIMIAQLLTLSSLSGINTSVSQAVARGYDGSLYKALAAKIKWGLIGGAGSILVGLGYLLQGDMTLGLSFLLIAPFIPLYDAANIYFSYYTGRKQFKAGTFYSTLIRIVQVILLISALLITKNLYLILFIYFVPQVVIGLFAIERFRHNADFRPASDPETVQYGKHLSVTDIISVIADQFDQLLIFFLLGPADLALYSFAIAPAEQIKSVGKTLSTLAMPKFAQADKAATVKTIFSKLLRLCIAFGIVALIYIPLAPILYKIFFPKYLDAVLLSQIFSISLVTMPLWILYTAMQAYKLTKQIYIARILTSSFQIIFTFIMVYQFGLWGAIIARMSFRFFSLFVTGLLFKKA